MYHLEYKEITTPMREIPMLEQAHSIYTKKELMKLFPNHRLYFFADYLSSGQMRSSRNGDWTRISDFWAHFNQNDEMIFKIDPLHLEEVRNHKAFLVYEMWIETGYSYVYWLYKKCIKAGIPTEQIILLGSSFDYVNIAKAYAEEFSVKPINVVYYSFFERNTKRHFFIDYGTCTDLKNSLSTLESLNDINTIEIPGPLQVNNFKKRYIFLNHYARPHRYALTALLHRYGLLDQGYVSFHDRAVSGDIDTFSFMLEYFDEPIKTLVAEGGDVKKLFPLKVDHVVAGGPRNPALMNNGLIDELVKTSFMHIVGETTFGTRDDWISHVEQNKECSFLTEKIFKCMYFKQPFILLSYPGTLTVLKKLGYKTFDEIIDESYDNEPDDTKRLYKVFCEIKKICELDEVTLEIYRQKMLPIVEHNFKVWATKKNYMHNLAGM